MLNVKDYEGANGCHWEPLGAIFKKILLNIDQTLK